MIRSMVLFTLLVAVVGRAEFITFRADLVPLSLTFSKVAEDDVHPSDLSLRIALEVKNIGNLAVTPNVVRYPLLLGGRVVYAYLYGPASRGGVLADKIFPGETGRFVVSEPLGSLSHCGNYSVRIDLKRELQKGDSSVFLNDTKTLVAIDPTSIRACIGPIKPLP